MSSTAQEYISRMSLTDLMTQMAQIDVHLLVKKDDSGKIQVDTDAVNDWIGQRGVGSVLNFVNEANWSIEEYRSMLETLQKAAHEHKRPPIIYGIDSVHGGNYFYGATVTPQPLNLAATFNVTCAEQAGALASRQTRVAGITWLFSPLLGIALSPRWSRVYETFGEDPVLVGELAAHMIRGIQMPDEDDKNSPPRAAACAKHFVGYSFPINGHDRAPSWIPTRHLYQYFVPPWKRVMKAVDKTSRPLTVMESYTETDGVPNVANFQTTNRLLRQTLGFDGVLVTDYQEMENLATWHHTAPDLVSAVQLALRQGTADMSMLPDNVDNFVTALQTGVDNHLISRERIVQSATRILQLKQDLGMLNSNDGIGYNSKDKSPQKYPYHERDREEALEMVRQSIVLVKNEQNLLPIQASAGQKILITGPTANSKACQSGGWTGTWQGAPGEDWFTYGNTVLEAFAAQSGWDVSFRCGVDILGHDCQDVSNDGSETQGAGKIWNQAVDEVKDWVGMKDDSSIARAVQAASSADIVVIAVGEEPYAEKPADIRSLELPRGQYELVQHIRENSTAKIVLVYFGGRPRLLRQVVDVADAVLVGFLPGPSAGDALVEIVTGQVNPSARLPLTYPMYDDGGGVPYFHSVSDQCTTGDGPLPHWQYTQCDVQWSFGHGLSYTTFSYSGFTATGGVDRDLQLSVTVENTGNRGGSETVLFFTFDEFRRTTPEYKLLRAFEKVYLEPGHKITVTSTIPLDDLRFIGPDDDTHYIMDPKMSLWAGVGSSTDCRADPDNALCVHLKPTDPDESYIAACEAACNIWMESGCGNFNSDAACLKQCTAISQYPNSDTNYQNQGWGWNYANCLESVLWGMKQEVKMNECWRMTTLCRDIFRTGTMDEYGAGSYSAPQQLQVQQASAGVTVVALLAGLVASGIIVALMKGYTVKRRSGSRPSTEFVRVGTHDLE